MVIQLDFCSAKVRRCDKHHGVHPDDPKVSGLWSKKISGDIENGGVLLACKANPKLIYIVQSEERAIYWYATRLESLIARKKSLKGFVKIDVLQYKNSLKRT